MYIYVYIHVQYGYMYVDIILRVYIIYTCMFIYMCMFIYIIRILDTHHEQAFMETVCVRKAPLLPSFLVSK